MSKSWNVIVYLKSGKESEYCFEGRYDEARNDAYLSFPKGDIQRVSIKPEVEEEEPVAEEQRQLPLHPNLFYRQATFSLLAKNDVKFTCFSNGSSNPYFTRALIEQLNPFIDSQHTTYRYDEGIDAYRSSIDDSEDEIYTGINIKVNTTYVRVYPIGGNSSIWEEYKTTRHYLNIDSNSDEHLWMYYHQPDKHSEEDTTIEVYSEPSFGTRRIDKRYLLQITDTEYDELLRISDAPANGKSYLERAEVVRKRSIMKLALLANGFVPKAGIFWGKPWKGFFIDIAASQPDRFVIRSYMSSYDIFQICSNMDELEKFHSYLRERDEDDFAVLMKKFWRERPTDMVMLQHIYSSLSFVGVEARAYLEKIKETDLVVYLKRADDRTKAYFYDIP